MFPGLHSSESFFFKLLLPTFESILFANQVILIIFLFLQVCRFFLLINTRNPYSLAPIMYWKSC